MGCLRNGGFPASARGTRAFTTRRRRLCKATSRNEDYPSLVTIRRLVRPGPMFQHPYHASASKPEMRPTILLPPDGRVTHCHSALMSCDAPEWALVGEEVHMEDMAAAAGAEHGGLFLEAVFLNDVETALPQLHRQIAGDDNSSVRRIEPAVCPCRGGFRLAPEPVADAQNPPHDGFFISSICPSSGSCRRARRGERGFCKCRSSARRTFPCWQG